MKPVEELFPDFVLLDLFKIELDTQCKVLNAGLIELEQKAHNQTVLESLMRAAHSIKGAARIVNLHPVVRLAHALEERFVAAQSKHIDLSVDRVDPLLRVVDFFSRLSTVDLKEMNLWVQGQLSCIEGLIGGLTIDPPEGPKPELRQSRTNEIVPESGRKYPSLAQDRVLRVTAQNLNRLMALASESLVESQWFYPFEKKLQGIKNNLEGISDYLDSLKKEKHHDRVLETLTLLHRQVHETRFQLSGRLAELDSFIRGHASLSDRLYQAVVDSRMRPFADGVQGFPRMVRDLAHQLGKKVRLEIEGKATSVDRDILERFESPLSHLLRNALDHGIESPEERIAVGKAEEGVIRLEACHRGGTLAITVSDDGRGLDIGKLRDKIIEKNLISEEKASQLTDLEVLDFLFLPGFSTSATVSEISGRGVGLDVVQSMVQDVGGTVRLTFVPGQGVAFHLQLPLTLSIIRALLVEVAGEVYAFPLAHIYQTVLVDRENVQAAGNHPFFQYEERDIPLVEAGQLLELSESQPIRHRFSVVVIGERSNSYGIVVDRLIGEKELVVHELDPRLGKISDISAGALMEDGSPLLIVDIEDMVLSSEALLSDAIPAKRAYAAKGRGARSRKRILIVDDSLTLREVECRLLHNQGYEVETAFNGIDGWNAVRIGHYDLVVTDFDMPRMNGMQLLRAIRGDARFRSLPVIIVSYQEGEEERRQALEGGANHYLTKDSLHDATLIQAIHDLIEH